MNKSSTLLKLENQLESATVLSQVRIKYHELSDEKTIIDKVIKNLSGCKKFAIRSSFSGEDSEFASEAGKYLSVLDVHQEEIVENISKVFSSYPHLTGEEIVFVQPYLENTVRSGVLFTNNPNNGMPYLIDNYVLGSGTNAITSGAMQGFKHICLINYFNKCEENVCLRLRKVIEECRQILGYEYMDIEYAQAGDSTLYILQVRPLIIQVKTGKEITSLLTSSRKFVENKTRKVPFLAGETTVFGVMPDWNPAEMIGRRPKRLALSLYRELITDSIWAYQRDNYGYKSLRSFPLLVEIGNQPYIDTRVSFNSLLPKGLSEELESSLVNYYLAKLIENQHLHDKIEFEIVLSSWTLDIDTKLSKLPPNISRLQRENLKEKLIALTRNIIQSDLVDSDIQRVKKMIHRREFIDENTRDNLSDLYWLLEDCKRWGTLPFAGLARAAFIATQVLKSLETVTGNHELFANFLGSLNTITSQMSRDINSLDKSTFLQKYGHLRPGTYDITSRSYREAYDAYFGEFKRCDEVVEIRADSNNEIESLLEESEIFELLGVTALKFLQFAKKSIFWREQAKFEFTKNLSGALDLINSIGSNFKIAREELAFLDIKVLLRAYSSASNLQEEILASIKKGKIDYQKSELIELPSVLSEVSDIISFTEKDFSPNFITGRCVAGAPQFNLDNLSGNIALIESADPGYDWIFQKGIIGLITAYGGVNSHMAVRCFELNLPAAIGVGERLFKEIRSAYHVNLDCGNRIIEYR